MLRYLFIYIFLCLFNSLEGQRVLQPKMIEFDWKGIVYKYEKSFDIRLHENGFAVAYNNGKVKSYDKTKYYHFEFGHTKDPKERRQNTNSVINFFDRSRSFIYAKQNVMLNLRVGVGHKKYLSEKAKRKGVAVGYTYEIGPHFAIMKPYYLELQYSSVTEGRPTTVFKSEKYSEDNAAKFLNQNGNDIFGASGFFKGIDEVFLRVGLQAKAGFHFAFGAYDKYVRAVEVGAMLDAFPKKIPLLVETEAFKNQNVFFRLYLSAQFGWRKNDN